MENGGQSGSPTRKAKSVGPLLLAGVMLLVVAAGILASRASQNVMAGVASEQILTQIREQIPDSHVPASQSHTEEETSKSAVVVVDGNAYVGTLALPSLKLELPVSSSCTNESLQKSPGCYEGSATRNDLIICGEGYETHFGRLGTLGIRDEVRFTTVDGIMYRYIVSNIESDRIEEIDAILDDWDLALFTFNANGTCLVVRCVRTNA